MCCVWIPKSQRLNILLFFSQFKLTLLNHQKSLQLNFIILVLFSCGLLINSFFPVDSTSDLPSYYFATILHLEALFKSQQVFGAVAKRSTLFGEVFGIKFLYIFGNIYPTLFLFKQFSFLSEFFFYFYFFLLLKVYFLFFFFFFFLFLSCFTIACVFGVMIMIIAWLELSLIICLAIYLIPSHILTHLISWRTQRVIMMMI